MLCLLLFSFNFYFSLGMLCILDAFVCGLFVFFLGADGITYPFQANMWLGTLLLEHSEDIYRMKGLLSVQGMNERFVFQVL